MHHETLKEKYVFERRAGSYSHKAAQENFTAKEHEEHQKLYVKYSVKQNTHILYEAVCTSGLIQISLHHKLVLNNKSKTSRMKKCHLSEVPACRIIDGTYSLTQEE